MPSTTDYDRLKELILSRIEAEAVADPERLRAAVADHHPADVAEVIADLPEETTHAILDLLEPETRAEVLEQLADIDETAVEDFVEETTAKELAEVVEEMDPDDAVDLLEVADEAKAQEIISHLDEESAAEVRHLRQYQPETAGGIMTTEYLSALPEESREEIAQHLRLEQDDVETVQRVLVCNQAGRLLGVVSAQELLAAQPEEKAAALMDTAVVSVVAGTDQEACANLMQKYDLMVLPVIDESGHPIGIITHDDILDVMEEEAEEDMYRMVGVGDDRPLEHGALERAVKRLPWLATTLIGMGLIGPLLLHRWFEATLEQVVVLAFFIPVIMGLSGNTATQSSTIAVRGLATEEIEFKDLFWLIRREISVALILASVCAVVVIGFVYLVASLGLGGGELAISLNRLCITVGLSMFIGILVSVVLGTSIPMLCHRAGVDPAIAAGPFITTIIDISTQAIYLGLATWLLLG